MHGIDGILQRRNLLVSLRGLGQIEVVEVGTQVVVGMLVAVGRDQLRQLLDIGADLQALDRSGEAVEVQIARLFHHLIEEVVDAEPLRHPAEGPELLAEPPRCLLAGALEEIEEASPTISCFPGPAARLDGIGGVARQRQEPHQADGVVRGIDGAKKGEAILDLGLLVEAAPAAHLVGDADPLQGPGKVMEVGVGAEENRDLAGTVAPLVDGALDVGSRRVCLLADSRSPEDAHRPPLPAGGAEALLEA